MKYTFDIYNFSYQLHIDNFSIFKVGQCSSTCTCTNISFLAKFINHSMNFAVRTQILQFGIKLFLHKLRTLLLERCVIHLKNVAVLFIREACLYINNSQHLIGLWKDYKLTAASVTYFALKMPLLLACNRINELF